MLDDSTCAVTREKIARRVDYWSGTDAPRNCPQPKEAQPCLYASANIQLIRHLDSSAHGYYRRGRSQLALFPYISPLPSCSLSPFAACPGSTPRRRTQLPGLRREACVGGIESIRDGAADLLPLAQQPAGVQGGRDVGGHGRHRGVRSPSVSHFTLHTERASQVVATRWATPPIPSKSVLGIVL